MTTMNPHITMGITGRWRLVPVEAFTGSGLFKSRARLIVLEVEERIWRCTYPAPPPSLGQKPKSEDETRLIWRRADLTDAANLDPSQQVKA